MVIKSGNYVDKDEMFTFAVLSIESFFFSSDSYTLLGLSTNSVDIFNKSSLEKDFPGQAQILFHPSSIEANTKQVWSQLVMTYPFNFFFFGGGGGSVSPGNCGTMES